MNRTTMAKLPGIFQRDGIDQIRVVIPQHLQATFGGEPKSFNRSVLQIVAMPAFWVRCTVAPNTTLQWKLTVGSGTKIGALG